MILSQEEGEEEKEERVCNEIELALLLVAIRRGLVILMADLRLEKSELRNISRLKRLLCVVFLPSSPLK